MNVPRHTTIFRNKEDAALTVDAQEAVRGAQESDGTMLLISGKSCQCG